MKLQVEELFIEMLIFGILSISNSLFMRTIKISLSKSEDAFIDRMVAEGQAANRVGVFIRALERFAEYHAAETSL
jgi:hypothetical protein